MVDLGVLVAATHRKQPGRIRGGRGSVVVQETFYQTVAQLSFTLLGLWWLVLQTKYREWIGNPVVGGWRPLSRSIFLPGAMSLLALLAGSNRVIWQVAFVVAGCFGIIAVIVSVRDAARIGSAGAWSLLFGQGARLVTLVLYGGIVVVALIPDVVSALGGVPLTVTGILVSLLVVLGLVLAWAYFVEPDSSEN